MAQAIVIPTVGGGPEPIYSVLPTNILRSAQAENKHL